MKLPKIKLSLGRTEGVKIGKSVGISIGGVALVNLVVHFVPPLAFVTEDPDLMAYAVGIACAGVAAVKQVLVDHTPLG